jgi:GNAT superfamily N-acetyltransferase
VDPRIRQAKPADADAVARVVADGFATYRTFTPPDWQPPDELELALGFAVQLRADDLWCGVVEDEGTIVGQVGLGSAALSRRPTDEDGLAHLQNLFVLRDHWGTGLATALLHAAIEVAGERGFRRVRLFTPVAQARARRFYEREGWERTGEAFEDTALPFPMVEYRYELTENGGSGSRGSG